MTEAAQPDVMLAFPHPGTVRAEFMMSVLMEMKKEDTRIGRLLAFPSGPELGHARNEIAGQFLGSPYEWLWMVDTDMVFTVNTLPALLASAGPDSAPVVNALTWASDPTGEYPVAYRPAPEHPPYFSRISLWEISQERGGLMEVGSTGCACMIVHRSVFTRIAKENPADDGLWFAEMTSGDLLYGEDFSFCLRCRGAGIPVFVHTGVRVGHIRTTIVGEASP